jgi:hypothetical protein
MVAAAALSLLVVTLVFAFDGFTGAAEEPAVRAAFLIEAQSGSEGEVSKPRTQAPVVIREPSASASKPVSVTEKPTFEREQVRAANGEPSAPTFEPRVRDIGPVTTTPTPADDPGPAAGDGVREVGDAVTSTLTGTGEAAGEATLPLGPPVSQAVQDVLDVVIGLLEGATSGLAGVLDRTAR